MGNNAFMHSNMGPILLLHSNNTNVLHQHAQSRSADRHPSANSNYNNVPNSVKGREKSGRGGSGPNVKTPGECDPFGIDIAPLNIFENLIIPVGVHNLSNHSDLIWLPSECYLWAKSLFQSGKKPT